MNHECDIVRTTRHSLESALTPAEVDGILAEARARLQERWLLKGAVCAAPAFPCLAALRRHALTRIYASSERISHAPLES
jgi:hypothetical protein